jgi:hypothetical protein
LEDYSWPITRLSLAASITVAFNRVKPLISRIRSACVTKFGDISFDFPRWINDRRAKAGSAEARFGARTRKTRPTQASRTLGTTTQNIDQIITQDNFQIHILF